MKKTILLTGATDGIGKLAAQKLAADGHQVLLHGRNAAKLEAVIQEISAATNNSQLKGFVADLADLNAVRQMAQQISESYETIDVLINNAGVFLSQQSHNADGIDLRLVVNYLAPVILTRALLPNLRRSDSARIINLSSAAQAPVNLAALGGGQAGSANQTYAQSKLALTMWSFHLAKQESGLSVIALNPGSLLNTKMVQEAYGKSWAGADKGANIIYDLAVDTRYEGITGRYYDNDRGGFGEAHADVDDQRLIDALVKRTDQVIESLLN
ncbi:MAG: SDR family NAD(P)-dependent oxidoreductase [Bacteroidota bacterium]